MKLGKFSLEQDLIVTKIDDLAGILGMDFLEVQNADIYVEKSLMKLNEQNIKLSKCRNETCAKIRLSEKVSIPAASEMFVEGYVDGKLKVDFVLVESTRYMQSKGLLLAKALVNVKNEEKCSFYLLNVTKKGVKVGPGSVIGVLSSVDVIDDVQRDSTTPKPSVLPEHLQPLIDMVSDGLTLQEREILIDLVK